MYPFKHLSGARAMARHVAEGGNAYDEFGKHITSLSEELAKLRKFKNYMGRSSVMAESLSEYMDVVKERVVTVKKTIESLQKPKFYAEAFEAFAPVVMEDVPADVAENWIDQLTIRQFNEELSDVFPYIYKLVSEASKAEDINPDDLDETGLQRYTGIKKYGKKGFEELQKAGREGAGEEEKGKIKDKHLSKEEIEIESAFEQMMGQFQDESFDPNAEPSQADLAMEEFMDTYEKGGEKALAAALRISEEELDQDINEWCAAHGKHADDDRDEAIEGVVQELVDDTNFDEGNAFAQKVRQAKANGKKKGDKVDGPDGDEITLEKDEKTPLGEFILSYFDRDNGSFPKGETAVLTMIEKDYGEEYITPAKQFIERINQTFEEYQMRVQPQQMENPEFDRIRELAGLR
tara:strand:- start:207 stop:1424 length:1218 start_codon:yes stop_codon:yes gene_type:complete